MTQLGLPKLRDIWKNDRPPPKNRPFYANAFVTLKIGNIALGGEVTWNVPLQTYVFQPAEDTGTDTYKVYEVAVAVEHYIRLRALIREELGVYVTRGLHVHEINPLSYNQQLPASVRCIMLNN